MTSKLFFSYLRPLEICSSIISPYYVQSLLVLEFFKYLFYLILPMSLKTLSYYDRNIVIREFYLKNSERGKAFVVKHFKDNYGLPRRTIYRILKKIDENPSIESLHRAKGSSGIKALNPRQEMAILKSLENKKGPSTRKAAGRYGVLQRTIQRTLHRLNAKCPKH